MMNANRTLLPLTNNSAGSSSNNHDPNSQDSLSTRKVRQRHHRKPLVPTETPSQQSSILPSSSKPSPDLHLQYSSANPYISSSSANKPSKPSGAALSPYKKASSSSSSSQSSPPSSSSYQKNHGLNFLHIHHHHHHHNGNDALTNSTPGDAIQNLQSPNNASSGPSPNSYSNHKSNSAQDTYNNSISNSNSPTANTTSAHLNNRPNNNATPIDEYYASGIQYHSHSSNYSEQNQSKQKPRNANRRPVNSSKSSGNNNNSATTTNSVAALMNHSRNLESSTQQSPSTSTASSPSTPTSSSNHNSSSNTSPISPSSFTFASPKSNQTMSQNNTHNIGQSLPPSDDNSKNSHQDASINSNNNTNNNSTRQKPKRVSTTATNAEVAAAVVAQEMHALKALKRLSIGALPTSDPDLPNYSQDLYRHSEANGTPPSQNSPSSSPSSASPPSSPNLSKPFNRNSIKAGSPVFNSFDFSSNAPSSRSISKSPSTGSTTSSKYLQQQKAIKNIRRSSSTSIIPSPKSPTFAESHDKSPNLSPTSELPNLEIDSSQLSSHASELLWVPAHVHPELAPQEWKTFVQNKVAEIKAKVSQSPSSSLSSDPSRDSSIHRRNSRLSGQIKDQESYTDGAEILEKRKSRDPLNDQHADPTIKSLSNQLKSLGELESLAMDPFQLARSLSLNTNFSYYSLDNSDLSKSYSSAAATPTDSSSLSTPATPAPIVPLANDSDSPILPSPTSSLRRSTRTRYNKSSIRRGRRDIVSTRPTVHALESSKNAKHTPTNSSGSETITYSPRSSLEATTPSPQNSPPIPAQDDSPATAPVASPVASPVAPTNYKVEYGEPGTPNQGPKIRIPITNTSLPEKPEENVSKTPEVPVQGNDYDQVPKIVVNDNSPKKKADTADLNKVPVSKKPVHPEPSLPQTPKPIEPDVIIKSRRKKSSEPPLPSTPTSTKDDPIVISKEEPVISSSSSKVRPSMKRFPNSTDVAQVVKPKKTETALPTSDPPTTPSSDYVSSKTNEKILPAGSTTTTSTPSTVVDNDESQSGKNKSRKGTWGWLFNGTSQSENPEPNGQAKPRFSEPNLTDKASVDNFLNRTPPASVSQPLSLQATPSNASPVEGSTSAATSAISTSNVTVPPPKAQSASLTPQSSKERLSSFFSKKKSVASLKQQRQAEQAEKERLQSDPLDKNIKYVQSNYDRNRSPSPGPDNDRRRRSRSNSPQPKGSSITKDKKERSSSKQRGRYRSRSRTRSPEGHGSEQDPNATAATSAAEQQLQQQQQSISAGQNITARPMPETSIVAYSPEAAAYYGAPYQIPAHQMSDKSLVMMHHRYPLHIERAIYRLSHLKLANPRRPLVQQVLLSNFMYAYLNLINQGYIQQQQQAQLQMQLQQQQQMQQLQMDPQQHQQPYDEEYEQQHYDAYNSRYDYSNNGSMENYDYDMSVNNYDGNQMAQMVQQQDPSANMGNGEGAWAGDSRNTSDEEIYYDTRESISNVMIPH